MTADQAHEEPIAAAPAGQLRIGVTGHRRLPNDPALVERVAQALDRIHSLASFSCGWPLDVIMISPLAE